MEGYRSDKQCLLQRERMKYNKIKNKLMVYKNIFLFFFRTLYIETSYLQFFFFMNQSKWIK